MRIPEILKDNLSVQILGGVFINLFIFGGIMLIGVLATGKVINPFEALSEPEEQFSWKENFLFLLFLIPVVIGYYLHSKKKYIEDLEDTIRILNAKFRLWEKEKWPEWGTSREYWEKYLKPEDDWEDYNHLGKAEGIFSKALFNSRKRMRKKK